MDDDREKDEVIKLFAFYNGWLSTWLAQQHEAMESLYDREFTLDQVAKHCVEKNYYNMDLRDYLRLDFIKAFFKPYTKVEMISLPDIGFAVGSPYVTPKIIEKSRFEEAWKYHIQKMVLLGDLRGDYVQERLNYLFNFIPKDIIEDYRKFKKERSERVLSKIYGKKKK